jgi:diadenosine tetraphosphate (Ap4A) HIT family hydrolase|tara:strand:+ start:601 stop:1005 length:405 start_codon:yes stop_codon:yes gene_type:complete
MAFTLHPTLAKDSILAAKVGPLQVRLVDDARFFWLLIVPETTATELHDLDEKTSGSLWKLAQHLGHALQSHCDSDKINSAAIGNIVPQLHFHIVARHVYDAAWPQPIWGYGKAEPLADATKAARIEAIQSWLGN